MKEAFGSENDVLENIYTFDNFCVLLRYLLSCKFLS